jgi:hypothetical protein
VEVRQESVDAQELEARRDEQHRPPRELGGAHHRLEHSHRRRPDREHTCSAHDLVPGVRGHRIALAVEHVLLEPRTRHRLERVEAHVQRHAHRVELLDEPRREVEPGRRSRCRPHDVPVHRLVARRIVERNVDVGRQWSLAGRLAFELDDPAPFAERLDEPHRPELLTRSQPARRLRQRVPSPVLEPLDEKHLDRASRGASET